VIEHALAEEQRQCESCGEPMEHIGDDVSELLEFVAAHFRVKEHRRAKYACRRCKSGVKTAPGPDKLIDKGLPGTGLLAHVVVSKYQDHLPLSRQSGIYQREGVEIPVSTLCDWVAAVADEMRPLADLIRERTLDSYLVQTDASGLKVLDRDDPEGVRKGTMWCYVGDRKWVYFEYAKTGAGAQGPWETLGGRDGYVQADASNVFDRVYNGQCGNATEVGCWAHARRKLYSLKDSDPRVAYPLQLIGKLYRVEAIADAQSLDAEARVELRKQRSSGILGRNGVDPYTYVKDVLDKLAAGWPQQRIDELLPDAWAASRATAQTQAQAERTA
jgi:transposase